MKTRIQSILLACLALMGLIVTSCTDTALVEMSDNRGTDRPFTLTVHPSASDSRLALGADGLKIEWEPGDKLVLVDKDRTLAPIYLSCTLTENAGSATFVSESGVPAGDYYVIYNYNDNLAYGHKPFQSIQDINDHDDLVLYNELSITEGASTASLSLTHLYAKVKVTLKNIPSGVSKFQVGMYSSKKGFPVYLNFTSAGLVNAEYGKNPNSLNYTSADTYFPSNRRYHNVRLGNYSSSDYTYDSSTGESTYDFSKAKEFSALVLPADLSDEDVFFYVLSCNSSINKAKCYEIKKTNVRLQAGTSYKVELDLNEAAVSELIITYDKNSYSYIAQLTDAKVWRHAAYRNETLPKYNSLYTYQIANDIDFQDEPFFPIAAFQIIGNDKTLSNIQLDWSDEDNVGLVKHEWHGESSMSILSPKDRSTRISNLTLENVTFKGNNYVGAFGGWNIEATNCKVLGTSVIKGQGDNVGGIVGCNTFSGSIGYELTDVQIGQSCQVQGKNYVGGIVGRYASSDWSSNISNASSSIMWLESCQSKATVTASGDYVGGIFGKIGGVWRSNANASTSVSFSMEDKTFSLQKCVNEGEVSGRHYVGGIGGEFAMRYSGSSNVVDRVVLSQSCSNADVIGDSKVGGILGSTQASTVLCYSTGTVTASSTAVGGVVGEVSGNYGVSRIANCYSLAPLSVGTGGHAGGVVGTISFSSIVNCYYAANPDTYTYGGIVGNSGGFTTVKNCLTTLASLGHNLGEHKVRTDCPDADNDGLPDWDYNNDGKRDDNDLYYFYNDDITNSVFSVTSILDNISVINGDNAYSTNIWDVNLYPWKCVKFASFSAETDAPDFNQDTL